MLARRSTPIYLVFWSLSFGLLAPGSAAAAAGPDALAEPDAPQAILGGELVAPCSWPTAVSIGGSCTGTLIHPRVVMYAAHCGDSVPWIRLTDAIENAEKRELVPERCEIHPVGSYGFGTDFAYCLLPEPIDDLPLTPPLMGCAAEQKLQVGQAVTLVGFGDSEEEYGIKRFVDTTIAEFSWDEVFIGNSEQGACYGDSGGPALVQLDDGTWRVFGVASWGKVGCGVGTYYSMAHNGVEWIEDASGFDVTPCHDARGNWDPSPACAGFALEPEVGGGSWPSCQVGQVSGYGETCGAPFDPALVDEDPPSVHVIDPGDRSRHNAPDLVGNVRLAVQVAAEDAGWGTASVTLQVFTGEAQDGDEPVFTIDDPAAPFVYPDLTFKTGVWTLRAEAVDRAGNIGLSPPVVFAVNMDPPPAPPPEEAPETTGDGTSGDSSASTDGGDDDDDDSSAQDPVEDEGGCRIAGRDAAPPWLLALAGLGLGLGLRRRRRRRGAALGVAAALPLLAAAGCGDDSSETSASAGTSEGDGSDGSDSEGATTGATTGEPASTGDASTGEPAAPGCGNGQVEGEELCDDGNLLDGDGCNHDCSPSGQVEWVSLVENSIYGDEGVQDLALTPDGATILATGVTRVEGDHDAWVGAFAVEDGALRWSTTFDHAGEYDAGNSVAVAADGTVYVGGIASVDETSAGLWLAAYDATGTELWTRVDKEGLDDDRYLDVAVTSAGDVLAFGTIDGDDLYQISFARLFDGAGAPLWTHELPPDVVGGAATLTAADEVIIASRQLTDPDTNTHYIWLRKLSPDGAPIWTHSFGHILTRYYTYDVAVAPDGTIVACGQLDRTQGGDTVISAYEPHGGEQRWIVKQQIPTTGPDACLHVSVNALDEVAIVGWGLFIDPVQDMWIGKLDLRTGAAGWTRNVGNIDYRNDIGDGLVLMDDGVIFAGGFMYNEATSTADKALVKLTP